MIKIFGGCLLLLAAYLTGLKIMEPAAEHIRFLEEGDLLYRILESEIRNAKTPLPLLFGELSDRTSTLWHNFFFELSITLSKNTEESFQTIYERLLKKTWKDKLSKEEQKLFLDAGRNLLSDDTYYQKEEIKQLSIYLNKRISQMKTEYTVKKKVVLVSCLCIGTLAVILLF